MTAPKTQKYAFTSRPDDCSLLDELLRVTLPDEGQIESFGASHAPAFARVMDPSWDGLSSPKGVEFKARAIAQACREFVCRGCPDPDSPRLLADAISTLRSDFDDPAKAETAIQKAINKASSEMIEEFACFGRLKGDGSLGALLMAALIGAASPEQLRKLGARILPPWQLHADPAEFVDPRAFASVYQAHLGAGGSLADILGAAASPGHSASEDAREKLGKMPPGPVHSVLWAEFERLSVASAVSASLGQLGAWDAKGLDPEKSAAILALVDFIERAHPGRGADEAIALLSTHPAIQALPATREAPPGPAARRI